MDLIAAIATEKASPITQQERCNKTRGQAYACPLVSHAGSFRGAAVNASAPSACTNHHNACCNSKQRNIL